eukprot:CCRYP_014126-RB/>CCRYP_014126-RB protein AED:0.43 eAED:0.54 QI:0/0/0/1/1/1/2/0/699
MRLRSFTRTTEPGLLSVCCPTCKLTLWVVALIALRSSNGSIEITASPTHTSLFKEMSHLFRMPYKKSLTFDSLNRLHRSISNRVRRTRSSFGPTDHSVDAASAFVDVPGSSVVNKSIGDINVSHESSLSTDASSSYSSLDADAALLSSTLVKVHQNTDGWHTGNWDDDTTATVGVVAKGHVMPSKSRTTTKLSLWGITCCGKIEEASSFDEERFVPYKISRRRSTIRPRMEIECVFRGDDEDASRKDLVTREDTGQHSQSSIPTHIVRTDVTCKTITDINNNSVFPSPSEWIHSPLLLTATPGSGTIIRRIRRVSDASFFPHTATMAPEPVSDDDIMGPYAQLPVNNGKELYTLVMDFETPSFEGTALFRIRGSNSDCRNPLSCSTPKIRNGTKSMAKSGVKENEADYFASYNRKFQMVIRGKFRRSDIAMADCMSGMLLDHPLRTTGSSVIDDPLLACSEMQPDTESSNGAVTKKTRRKKFRGSANSQENLPPKWVLRASVKIAGLFSPRIDADLECSHPRILGPLCSMAQSLHVARGRDSPVMDLPHVEPHFQSKESLVHDLRKNHSGGGVAGGGGGSHSSVQIRKKAFDSVYDARMATLSLPQSSSPCFDPNAVYTFEFLQHLIDYNDFSLDFGSIVGKMKLGGALKGQPCRFVAGVVPRKGDIGERDLTLGDLDCLWSFDLWHETLHVGKREVDL